jgi:hypothetical protein
VSERVSAGRFQAGGIAITIETNRPGFAALVADTFRDLEAPEQAAAPVVFEVLHQGTPPPANPWAVWRDGEPREMAVSDGYILTYVLWEISRLMFERTGGRVHLHGAALVRGGRAVVLAGRTRAGKSTLAGWLTHRGWGFLTDEAALVDPETLIVSPFWRPINVRRPGPLDAIVPTTVARQTEEAEVLVPASALGSLAEAAPLCAIAFPCYTSDEEPGLDRTNPAAALLELTQHFPGLVADGRAGFRRLARLVAAVPAYRLVFGDLDDAERSLRTLTTGRS